MSIRDLALLPYSNRSGLLFQRPNIPPFFHPMGKLQQRFLFTLLHSRRNAFSPGLFRSLFHPLFFLLPCISLNDKLVAINAYALIILHPVFLGKRGNVHNVFQLLEHGLPRLKKGILFNVSIFFNT